MIERQFLPAKYFTVLIGLLQERRTFLEEVGQGVKIQSKIVALLVSSSIFFAIYGGIVGASHSVAQAISSAIKLPALYLMTLIICLPTLYFFNIFFGSRKSFGQHFALLLGAVAVISVLLFSFAPVTLFFLMTTNTKLSTNYLFFTLLNVGILALTGFIGVNFFYKGMQQISEEDTIGQESRQKILQLWLVLYACVGSQLGWTLRPFFGTPGSEFVPFRQMEGNVYLSILQSLMEILKF